MGAIWEHIQILPADKVQELISGKAVVGESVVPVPPGKVTDKKVVILIPHQGDVSMEWAIMWQQLPLMVGSHYSMSKGSPIDITRDTMANNALDQGYEWMFFLDSDVLPPKDVIQKLLSHNLPIVAGLYKARKPEGFTWAAWIRGVTPTGDVAFAPIASWGKDSRLFQADVTGCGCMLVHRDVFLKIREKFPDLPFFFWSNTREKRVLDKMNIPDPAMRNVSEDFWFCLLAKQAGFSIVMDGEAICEHVSVVKIGPDNVTLTKA